MAIAILYATWPDVIRFLGRRMGASVDLLASGNERVFSGRVETWRVLTTYLMDHPQHAVFGVGYKTLPYSDFIGQPTVADNAYLGALVETGIVGLAALLLLHAAALRMAWRARSDLYGMWFLCFWAGEAVQMLSGDLLTYWRVLPLYFWALAMAVRRTRERA
jgi:O-antigen ligase